MTIVYNTQTFSTLRCLFLCQNNVYLCVCGNFNGKLEINTHTHTCSTHIYVILLWLRCTNIYIYTHMLSGKTTYPPYSLLSSSSSLYYYFCLLLELCVLCLLYVFVKCICYIHVVCSCGGCSNSGNGIRYPDTDIISYF